MLSFPDVTVHFELKHLLAEVTKNDVLIFNQKGLDFLLAEDHMIRRFPFYRILLERWPGKPCGAAFRIAVGHPGHRARQTALSDDLLLGQSRG